MLPLFSNFSVLQGQGTDTAISQYLTKVRDSNMTATVSCALQFANKSLEYQGDYLRLPSMPTLPVYHICPKNVVLKFTLIQLIMRKELDFCRFNIADISPSSFISFISLRDLAHFSHSSKNMWLFPERNNQGLSPW